MLENIAMILSVFWLAGGIWFTYMIFFMKINGSTIIDSAYEKALEDIPAPEKVIVTLLNSIVLCMIIFWPITLLFMLGKKTNS